MCTDSPTGSRDSFILVHSCAAQEHSSCCSADAASAYLQAGRIERLLLLMMPKRQPSACAGQSNHQLQLLLWLQGLCAELRRYHGLWWRCYPSASWIRCNGFQLAASHHQRSHGVSQSRCDAYGSKHLNLLLYTRLTAVIACWLSTRAHQLNTLTQEFMHQVLHWNSKMS